MREHGGIFVMGTGASSGKTMVTRGLCRLAADQGLYVRPYKAVSLVETPVALGDRTVDRSLAMLAVAARTRDEHLDHVCTYAGIPVKSDGRSSRLYSRQGPELSLPILCDDQLDWNRLPHPEYMALLARVQDDIVATRSEGPCIIEGSACPADALGRDLANVDAWQTARLPILLVAGGLRGGCVASMVGTVRMLPPPVRDAVVGFVLNGAPTVVAAERWARLISEETGLKCITLIRKLPDYSFQRTRKDQVTPRMLEAETATIASELSDLWDPLSPYLAGS